MNKQTTYIIVAFLMGAFVFLISQTVYNSSYQNKVMSMDEARAQQFERYLDSQKIDRFETSDMFLDPKKVEDRMTIQQQKWVEQICPVRIYTNSSQLPDTSNTSLESVWVICYQGEKPAEVLYVELN